MVGGGGGGGGGVQGLCESNCCVEAVRALRGGGGGGTRGVQGLCGGCEITTWGDTRFM